MKKMMIGAVVMAGAAFSVQQAMADSVTDQLTAFQSERHYPG